MKLRSDTFLHRRAIPTRCAFGRHRFYPRELEAHERFELSGNLNPHLAWEDPPDGTRSFALVVRDPDAPADASRANQRGEVIERDATRATFVHWVLVDLPASSREIAEGAYAAGVVAGGKPPGGGPDGGRQGINDYTGWFESDADMRGTYHGYDGPCPPWNDALIHMYRFTLHALDVETLTLGDDPAFGAAEVEAAMKGHVLAEATLEGFYFIDPDARFR